MIMLDGTYIPLNAGTKDTIPTFLKNINIDYFEVDRKEPAHSLYIKRRKKNPYFEEVTVGKKEFVPIEHFARHISLEEYENRQDEINDADYEDLIDAFTRTKMHEAYDKYSNNKLRNLNDLID